MTDDELTSDPLLARIRALPRPAPSAGLAADVHRRARAALAPRPRWHALAAAAVGGGAVAYFGWAIAFVLAGRL